MCISNYGLTIPVRWPVGYLPCCSHSQYLVNDDGNFWILDDNKNPDTRNWLQNVWDADVIWKANNKVDPTQPNQGPRDTFFSHMSAAVAWSCSGIVYIMAEGVYDNLPSSTCIYLIYF